MDGTEFRSPPKRIILGDLNQNGGSPVSPMANLKLLTKVATSHFPVGKNSEYVEVQLEKGDSKFDKPSRRLRSLSFICKKFLSLYKLDMPPGNSQQFSLGHLALSLGIEKRRVYDIINVVSSLHMAVRVCKDKYNWLGNQNLPILLSQLKAFALINKFDEQIITVLHNQLSYSSATTPCESPFIKITRGDRSVFEENRIGILCQKFIMLFLVSDQEIPLNMCTISKLILTGDVKDKTGMRRLYDIANVLEALDLIKRYNCKIMKKPSFKYCGPLINVSRDECEKLLPKEFSSINQISDSDQGDTNSDSSLDCARDGTSKLDSILEVVCTELEEENCLSTAVPVSQKRKRAQPSVIQCSRAKKQLFPSPFLVDTMDMSNTFVRAPKRSFRLEFNELQVKESPNKDDIPMKLINEELKQSQPTVSSKNECQESNFINNLNILESLEKSYPIESKFQIAIKSQCQPDTLSNSNNVSNVQKEPIQNKTLVLRKIPNHNTNSIVPTKFKVLRPMKISDIQNGGIYKVLKKGNSVQLYALYD